MLPSPTDRATNPWLRRLFWLNLAVEVLIVVTGGLVRLTGSGLGCPTWPRCTDASLTPDRHDALGIHTYIEFGNRTLTSLVGGVAIALLVATWRWAPHRKGLRLPIALVLLGVGIQAIVGGITVHMDLNPAIVAAHLLASMLLVMASAWLVWREREGDGQAVPVVRREVRLVSYVVGALAAVILVLGTLVTGSGPHSGDADQPARLDIDSRTISWLHADTVMLFVGLVVAVLIAVRLTSEDQVARRAWAVVLGVTLAQGLVGYTQYFTGLPWVIVLVHMLGASLLVIATTWGILSLRHRPAAQSG
ncbi:COX15/CtaA family protein [Luteipulveratus mongoliensis]|uniref:Cytochrome oxidase assembly protein n=1 Tax=Luteipulveratus mongoliensis TaxID=571913 RepID=A0A0K1JJC0_9MICO|nr:COX15/CtaA family protein [Luteipulveratus mongoliensis]AKU16814.1 cytochrome oxidase assembly protein [Luteipulveratus mongoliensis]